MKKVQTHKLIAMICAAAFLVQGSMDAYASSVGESGEDRWRDALPAAGEHHIGIADHRLGAG